jgi:hypothetical protein
MITFQTTRLKEDFDVSVDIKPKLRDLMNKLDAFSSSFSMPSLYITSILRKDDLGQHSTGEAFDVRLIDVGATGGRAPRYTLEQLALILDYLETNFPRFDKGPSGKQFSTARFEGRDIDLHLHISIDTIKEVGCQV